MSAPTPIVRRHERTWPLERTWIGRCRHHGCGRGRRIDTVRRVEAGQETFHETDAGARYQQIPNWALIRVRCECGRACLLEPLSGAYKQDRKCGSRCMAATGPSCECQCGGANHGRSWA